MILEQVTSISNPPEVMLNRKVIKKCHSTIAIDRTFTIALPEWQQSSEPQSLRIQEQAHLGISNPLGTN